MKTGSCLCGAVKYEAGALSEVTACHCTQCRKQTGNYWSSMQVKESDFVLTEQRGLKWFRSSSSAQRGFCGECGSSLFWKADGRDNISVTAGTIDGKTGNKLGGHIFCDDAGDYYEIAGGDYKLGQW